MHGQSLGEVSQLLSNLWTFEIINPVRSMRTSSTGSFPRPDRFPHPPNSSVSRSSKFFSVLAVSLFVGYPVQCCQKTPLNGHTISNFEKGQCKRSVDRFLRCYDGNFRHSFAHVSTECEWSFVHGLLDGCVASLINS